MKLTAYYREIDRKITQLENLKTALRDAESLLSSRNLIGKNTTGKRMRRTLSAAARKRIAAAQRARWAVWHKKNRS